MRKQYRTWNYDRVEILSFIPLILQCNFEQVSTTGCYSSFLIAELSITYESTKMDQETTLEIAKVTQLLRKSQEYIV